MVVLGPAGNTYKFFLIALESGSRGCLPGLLGGLLPFPIPRLHTHLVPEALGVLTLLMVVGLVCT